jgi:hypothetical protein
MNGDEPENVRVSHQDMPENGPELCFYLFSGPTLTHAAPFSLLTLPLTRFYVSVLTHAHTGAAPLLPFLPPTCLASST